MDFTTAVKTSLSKYVTFSGRAARSEFWYFLLFTLIAYIPAFVIDIFLFNGRPILYYLCFLGLLLPGVAVSARRLHDIDKSAWWLLLAFVPLVGAIILIVWYCQRGTIGPNQFGPDPLPSSALPPGQPQALVGR
jgi:uncharacterized membrane protein YhaH (DUF805 family)